MKYRKLGVTLLVVSIVVAACAVSYILIETKPNTSKTDLRKIITGIHTSEAKSGSH